MFFTYAEVIVDYIAMVGKLVSWWLVSDNKRIGYAIGVVASLAMAAIVYHDGTPSVFIYFVLVSFIQVRGYLKHGATIESEHDEREEILSALPFTD